MKKILKIKNLVFSSAILSLFLISCNDNEMPDTNQFNTAEQSVNDEFINETSRQRDTPPDDGGCHEEDAELTADDMNIEFSPDINVFYGIRDNVLKKSIRGNKYIEQYYSTSNVTKDYSNFGFAEFRNITGLLPNIYSAYNKMIDDSYRGIIVDNELREKLHKVLLDHKKLSSDRDYNSMIDGLINDANYLQNKSKLQLNEFMRTE